MATGQLMGGAGRSLGGADEDDGTQSGELQHTVLTSLSNLKLDLPSDFSLQPIQLKI
jgi:hypothetical protein